MHEQARILLLAEGAIGEITSSLLRNRADVTTIDVRQPLPAVNEFSVMALAAHRPYPDVAEHLDKLAFAENINWCSAIVVAHRADIGPIVAPGYTPCYQCFRHRRAAHAEDQELDGLLDEIGSRSRGNWFAGEAPAFNTQIASLLADEILGLLDNRFTGGYCWQLNAATGATTRHVLDSVAYCERCTRDACDGVNLNRFLMDWAKR